jgi:hypothetical protein
MKIVYVPDRMATVRGKKICIKAKIKYGRKLNIII